MPLEIASKSLPSLMIKAALAVKTVDRAIGHIQSVMRVIMCEKALAPEGKQAIDPSQPCIERLKMVFIALAIDWIGLSQASCDDPLNGSSDGDPPSLERPGYQATQLVIAFIPLGTVRRAREFRAQHREMFRPLAVVVMLRL